jgi:hypothetical protein
LAALKPFTPMDKLDLDLLASRGCQGCGKPVHEHGFYFHSKCHPNAPAWIFYQDGRLRVECAVCRTRIAEVKVA